MTIENMFQSVFKKILRVFSNSATTSPPAVQDITPQDDCLRMRHLPYCCYGRLL